MAGQPWLLAVDQIRADIETTFTKVFNPASFDPTRIYQSGDYCNLAGTVWFAVAPVTGIDPVEPEWINEGESIVLIYENVEAIIPTNGALRLAQSWAETSTITLGRSGRWNRCDGTLTVWVYTPLNQGTSTGLRIAARIRETFLLWEKGIFTCGSQVTMTNPDGPRSILPAAGATFHGQLLTCSLTAIETVS